MSQGSTYDQLHRDIVIRSDIYGGSKSKPRILAASTRAEGIIGIPGLRGPDGIELAAAAGAGIVADLINRDPAAPLRNITSASDVTGTQASGFSNSPATETFMDGMPIVFSHPVLPSTVLPQNFSIRLNTGEVVTPLYVGVTPAYDFNERQTIVAYGDFGNRQPSSDPNAIYPVGVEVVESDRPLKLLTPRGLMNGTGLIYRSNSNNYDPYNGPTLVGAKLSRLSLAGDYPPPAGATAIGNHGVEYYGTNDSLYRLRLFTSAGLSPDGVSGLKPQQFARFFQLTARGRNGKEITIGTAGTNVNVSGGSLRVKGIADLGTGLSANPGYTYSEDHDNQFDVIIKASNPRAIRSLKAVVLPDPRTGTHSPLYNPGGPGTAPRAEFDYAQPSGGQTLAVEFALRNPATVSYAAQSLAAYDSADDLAVAFRLRDPVTGEWRLTSSSAEAKNMVGSGDWELVDVPFAANPSDRYVTDVVELRNSQHNDTVYSANPRQIRQLERTGYQNLGTAITAYDQPLRGLDPIWQLISPSGQHGLASSRQERRHWLEQGWSDEGIAFYSVAFPNATGISL